MPFPDPSVTPPNLSSGPYRFSYGGLAFGAPALPAKGASSGDFQLITADGLDMPAVRSGDVSRPRDQGQFIGLNLFDGRDITVELGVIPGFGYSSAWAARQALAAAITPNVITETPFYYQPPTAEGAPLLVCMARCTKANWSLDTLALEGLIPYFPTLSASGGGMYHLTAQFHATDPRWYVAPTQSTGPITPGLTHTFVNSGTFEMRPIAVITGPCTNPGVNSITLGANLQFHDPSNPSPYDLLAGDTLTIDLDSHAVTKHVASSNVDISVPNWFVSGSTWWNLVPGSNTIGFSASASGPGAGLTLKWSSAYAMA